MAKSAFFLVLLFFAICHAENLICNNTEEYNITETGCYSFGDEFVFVSDGKPKYEKDGNESETGLTCFDRFSFSANRKTKKFSKNGFHYDVWMLDQYCCKYQIFRTNESRWGNENDGYVDFSIYGNFGVFFSECEYQETDLMDTIFTVTKLQKPFDEVDILNLATNVGEMFGSRENAMMKIAVLYSLVEKANGNYPFKIYRQNGTLKYIGSVNLGFCMSKNGKRALDFTKGPLNCK